MERFDELLARHAVTPREIVISLGICSETVRLWRLGRRKVSIELAREIERKFHIPRHELRPDVWEPPVASTRRRTAA